MTTLTPKKSLASNKIFFLETRDIYLNLAFEEWLFQNHSLAQQHFLLMYVNTPTVVLGRFQNPWKETCPSLLKNKSISLARRITGGGTVFHDEGNLNFSYISPQKNLSLERNYQIIQNAFQKMGINLERNCRNDLLVEGYKVSGSAFRQNKTSHLHHGTLLLNSNLDFLKETLIPQNEKISGKERPSVRSAVANLSSYSLEVTHKNVKELLIQSYQNHFLNCSFELVSEADLFSHPEICELYKKNQSLQWLFNSTPEFSCFFEQTFHFGDVEIEIKVKKGIIISFQGIGGALHPMIFEKISSHFIFQNYFDEDLYEHSALLSEFEMFSDEISEVFHWLKEKIYN